MPDHASWSKEASTDSIPRSTTTSGLLVLPTVKLVLARTRLSESAAAQHRQQAEKGDSQTLSLLVVLLLLVAPCMFQTG